MLDDKNVLHRDQFVVRAIYIVFTSMIALAFIVISFVSNTWESIPAPNRYFAFTLISASGSHFISTLGYILPGMLLWRTFPRATNAVAICMGGISYIYSALILQHWGLTKCLLPMAWKSVFPFGQYLIAMTNDGRSEAVFYFAPMIASWVVLSTAAVLLHFAETGVNRWNTKAEKAPKAPGAAAKSMSVARKRKKLA